MKLKPNIKNIAICLSITIGAGVAVWAGLTLTEGMDTAQLLIAGLGPPVAACAGLVVGMLFPPFTST